MGISESIAKGVRSSLDSKDVPTSVFRQFDSITDLKV